ncbi:50S ribosomal protein L21 [Chlamydiales bacterium SCGC AG-110-M15]|nr:50S ribosomal protein L21 [Chlamydiales bacterium SCGC AG-110-M15]
MKDAIFRFKGKQYKVKAGDVIDVDLFDAADDKAIEFGEVLFVNDGDKKHVGAPCVSGFVVKGELLQECVKGEKVISYKFKRRQNYHRKMGHRQKYTRVKITEIAAA